MNIPLSAVWSKQNCGDNDGAAEARDISSRLSDLPLRFDNEAFRAQSVPSTFDVMNDVLRRRKVQIYESMCPTREVIRHI